MEDAWRLVESYVEHYNNVRLNSATGYGKAPDISARDTASKPREERSGAE